ncbi:MAG: hypothetical protein GZ090_05090 [Oxalobacteraceae bacterium]|nr:hypothetical protein [Oxalobacteraceae bacterium]
MRNYAKVSAKFWVGATGKQLRSDSGAQLVALYLMTCPNSEMTGVFHCPLYYIAHETGLGLEGASKGLQRLIQEGFCSFDDNTETVFVHQMARYQIADELQHSDKQVKGVQKAFATIAKGPFRQAFFDRYKTAFHLEIIRLPEGPSKPPASQEQEQEQFQDHLQEKEHEQGNGAAQPLSPPEILIESKKPTTARQEISLPAYLAECKQSGVNAIPDTDPVFAYAESIGLGSEFLSLHWLEFKNRYSLPDAKKYKDWRVVFGKSVRGNWCKVWYANADGLYSLTTTGLQARTLQKKSAAGTALPAQH